MFQRDRQVVPDFDELECLYLRYGAGAFLEGQLAPGSIRFPKTSVNRASLSEPEDALFAEDGRYNGWGVVQFRVSDLPSRIEQDHGPAYVFFMRHVPLSDNYSHSEIWSDQDPSTGDYREPSKTVKFEFRIKLVQRIRREQIQIEAVTNRVDG